MTDLLSVLTESTKTTRPLKVSVDKYAPGTWHGQDSGPLDRALSHVADACPALIPLARFVLPRVPRALLCSNTLKTENPSSHTAILPRAVRRQWVGWQAPGGARVNALCIDCDKEGWREALRSLIDRGVPGPAYVAVSKPRLTIDEAGNLVGRDYETAHLVWFLKVPVRRDNPVSYDLFKRTRAMLVDELGGDTAAANHLTKNPFHRAYVTEAMRLEPVDLSDLFKPLMEWCGEGEYVLPPPAVPREGKPRPRRAAAARAPAQALDPEEVKKWGKLFAARHAVMAEGVRDLPTITAILEEHAGAHCARPVDHRERRILDQRIKDHAASIHHWMNTAWKGRKRPGIDHQVMTRDAIARNDLAGWQELDWTSRRKLAAERTTVIRQERTARAIAAAVVRLWADEQPITQAAVAAGTGLDVRQVRRLWNRPDVIAKEDIRSYQGFAPGGEGGGQPVTTLRALAAASRERARAARAEAGRMAAEERRRAALAAEAIEGYRALAAAMLRSGAMPQPVPPGPMDSHPAVRTARAEAMDARRDCQRRATGRRDRAAAKVEAEERRNLFTRLAAAGDVAGFQAWMAREEERWGWVVDSEEGPVKRRAFMRRAVAFKRYRAEWDTALTVARHAEALRYEQECRSRQAIVVPPALGGAEVSVPSWPAGMPMPSFIRAGGRFPDGNAGQPSPWNGNGCPAPAGQAAPARDHPAVHA